MFSELVERGLSVIPVQKSSKAAILNDWSDFSHRLPTQQEAEDWDTRFNGFNIGVVLGPASNLLCVDIDTNDKKILDACPLSPVRRFGRKGEARFFQFNPDIESKSFRNDQKQTGIDILSIGRQVVLPPSIHPETLKPYVWLTTDTLDNFPINELPFLSLDEVDAMRKLIVGEDVILPKQEISLSGIFENTDPSRQSPHGSQDRLKKLASILVNKESNLDAAVKELIDYDNLHHKPVGYFSERGRHSDGKADTYSNAARFYTSVMLSINRSKLRNNEPASTPAQIPTVDLSKMLNKNKFLFTPYPVGRGLMADFQRCCTLSSNGSQDALSLGGAIALVAAISSNRFASKIGAYTVSPNTFVLNLGYSSFGKEVPQGLISDVLMGTGLIGSGGYRSGTSIVQHLPIQQERVDLIDEASSFLRAMTAREIYQREMAEILSSLFSKAGSFFSGLSSAGHGSNFGACYNPCVSLLASTTPTGFRESVNRGMESKGLMPRFLTFLQNDVGNFKEVDENDAKELEITKQILQSKVNRILSVEKIEHPEFNPSKNLLAKRQGQKGEDLSMGVRYAPIQLPFTKEARAAYTEFTRSHFNLSRKDADGFESAFLGRFGEHACKLALLDAVSLERDAIELDSFEWGASVVTTQWHNIRSYYELASGTSTFETELLKVKKIVEDAGVISKRDLARKTQSIQKRLRDEIIDHLKDTGEIQVVQAQAPDSKNQHLVTYLKIASS